MIVGTKQGQWMARDLWLKGSNGVLGRAAWQVLRLRRSQSARTAALRMTNLGWVEENRQKQEQARIPFGNDKQERQEQEQEQEQQPIQWSIRCAQDDESWGGVGFVKNEHCHCHCHCHCNRRFPSGMTRRSALFYCVADSRMVEALFRAVVRAVSWSWVRGASWASMPSFTPGMTTAA